MLGILFLVIVLYLMFFNEIEPDIGWLYFVSLFCLLGLIATWVSYAFGMGASYGFGVWASLVLTLVLGFFLYLSVSTINYFWS